MDEEFDLIEFIKEHAIAFIVGGVILLIILVTIICCIAVHNHDARLYNQCMKLYNDGYYVECMYDCHNKKDQTDGIGYDSKLDELFEMAYREYLRELK